MSNRLLPASSETLSRQKGFVPAVRYNAATVPTASKKSDADIRREIEQSSYACGLAEGREQMRAEMAAERSADIQAMEKLEVGLGSLDADLRAQLKERLKATVLELCESFLAPAAADVDALEMRIEKVIEMVSGKAIRILKLHPLDMEFIAKRLPSDIAVQADGSMERGSLRVETSEGGLEDGPHVWRRAVADALSSC